MLSGWRFGVCSCCVSTWSSSSSVIWFFTRGPDSWSAHRILCLFVSVSKWALDYTLGFEGFCIRFDLSLFIITIGLLMCYESLSSSPCVNYSALLSNLRCLDQPRAWAVTCIEVQSNRRSLSLVPVPFRIIICLTGAQVFECGGLYRKISKVLSVYRSDGSARSLCLKSLKPVIFDDSSESTKSSKRR